MASHRIRDHLQPLNQVKVGIMDDSQVNAASTDGGEFYVTTGLPQELNALWLAS
jgi:hypothetical protein